MVRSLLPPSEQFTAGRRPPGERTDPRNRRSRRGGAPEPCTSVVLLLRPEQAAWLRNHAGRRGVSALMRSLLDQLIEEERREIERARRRLRQRGSAANAPAEN